MAPRKSTGFELDSSLSHLLRRAQQFAYDQYTQQDFNLPFSSVSPTPTGELPPISRP